MFLHTSRSLEKSKPENHANYGFAADIGNHSQISCVGRVEVDDLWKSLGLDDPGWFGSVWSVGC